MAQWTGKRLRDARLRRGWSQEELARAARTSVTNVSRWERDLHCPGGDSVQALASAVGIEPTSFFEDLPADPDADAVRLATELVRLLKKAAA